MSKILLNIHRIKTVEATNILIDSRIAIAVYTERRKASADNRYICLPTVSKDRILKSLQEEDCYSIVF